MGDPGLYGFMEPQKRAIFSIPAGIVAAVFSTIPLLGGVARGGGAAGFPYCLISMPAGADKLATTNGDVM